MFTRLLRSSTLGTRQFSQKPYAIYANYRIFKGKGSLGINAIPPTFKEISNQGGHSLAVERPGVMLLEFVPSVGERQFDYTRKQLFALSASECGEIVAKTAKGEGCSLVHDPSKYKGMSDVTANSNGDSSSSDMKRVNVDPTPQGDGFFVSIQSNQNKLSIPVSTGEFVVVRQLLLGAIPHLLGFDAAWNLTAMSPEAKDFGGSNFNSNSNSGGNTSNYNNSSSSGGGGSGGGGGGGGGNKSFGGNQQMGGNQNSNNKPVFNPFENQQNGGTSGGNKGSNWLDEL